MPRLHRDTINEPVCTPGDARPGAVLAVLAVGTIMAPLDSSIVNIALPSIAAEFSESLTGVGWVTTAYLFTTASLLLTMGRLGDVWGLRRLYVTGLAIFGVGSLACAFAGSLPWLISARVLQAVGSAMIFAAGPALVTRTFPPNRRGWALGYISLAVSVGLTAGPALGGLLVGTFGWPSIFLINIPLVAVTGVAAWRLLPEECPEPQRFDLPGAVLVAAGLLLLLLGLGGAEEGGFLSGAVLLPMAGSGLALALFIAWERRAAKPMVDLAMFRVGAFSAGLAAAALAYLSLFAVTFTMPFYLTRVLGMDTRVAGLFLTVTPLAMAAFAPAAGRLSDRRGSRGLATLGLLVLSAGLATASFLKADGGLALVAVALLLTGGGMAVFQTPNTAAVLRATPRERAGVGSAFVAEARNVGMSVGIALTAGIVGAAMGATGLPGGDGGIPAVTAAAFVGGASTALRVAAAISLVAAALSWFGREDDSGGSAGNP